MSLTQTSLRITQDEEVNLRDCGVMEEDEMDEWISARTVEINDDFDNSFAFTGLVYFDISGTEDIDNTTWDVTDSMHQHATHRDESSSDCISEISLLDPSNFNSDEIEAFQMQEAISMSREQHSSENESGDTFTPRSIEGSDFIVNHILL